MLTPETLERLIISEKKNCENWLWDQISAGSDLITPLKDMCRRHLKCKKSFWHTNLILLISKSLTQQISIRILHFASLCELLTVARDIRKKAINNSDNKNIKSDIDNPDNLNNISSSTLHLMSDALQNYVLEQISAFNLPRLNEQFANAQKIFSEAELFSNILINNKEDYEKAYKALISQKKPKLIKSSIEGAARICGTHLSQIKELGNYAEQLSIGISLINEVAVYLQVDEGITEFINGLGNTINKDAFNGHSPYVLFNKATLIDPNNTQYSAKQILNNDIFYDTSSTIHNKVLKNILEEANSHFENAFSSLVSLNSFQQQTPLLALVELAIAVCQKMSNKIELK